MTKELVEYAGPKPSFKETQFGFDWGPMKVVRYGSATSGKSTSFYLGIETPKGTVEVYCTKTGKLRVFKGGQEMLVKEEEDGD